MEGAIESFDLVVLPWTVGTDEGVTVSEGGQGRMEVATQRVVLLVVTHQFANGGNARRVEGRGGAKDEVGTGHALLVARLPIHPCESRRSALPPGLTVELGGKEN